MEELSNNLWFEKYKDDNTSQYGEDGIISKIFSLIGVKNKYVVECGASNGVVYSSTRSLVVKEGWSALFIEADPTAFDILKKNYADYPTAHCLNSFVSFEGDKRFDSIFRQNNVPKNFDLLILDVDGNEYHIWNSLKEYKPRVIVVEFNPTIPNEVDFVQPKDMSVQQGSSFKSFKRLGEELGYRLVAVTDVNAFFVIVEESGPFLNLDNSLDCMRARNPYETKIFQLYDGTLKIDGYNRLLWHRILIDEEKLQILPKNKRIYLNGVSSNDFVRKVKYLSRQSFVYPLIKKVRSITFFRNIMR